MLTETHPFDRDNYPHGCRCACCREWFEDGDMIVYRFIGDMWVTPTCEDCAEAGADLCADHPLRGEKAPVLCADGMVR